MGILERPAMFVAELKLPAGFSVCELGNQQVSGVVASSAESFYRSLGCGHYVSIDANGQGTVTADLNRPINVGANTDALLDQFDLVTDFGTGEHIFDQAQVWHTIHDLTKPGGYIAFDRPSQGYGKHCFYLTTECLFRDLAAANDYTVIRFEKAETARGNLLRGVFRTSHAVRAFQVPQQGRYQASLRLEVAR